MKTWIQRPAHTHLGPSPSEEFHGCLDALITTARRAREAAAAAEYYCPEFYTVAQEAEERAAICAGLLFDRWIEERGPLATGCRGVGSYPEAEY